MKLVITRHRVFQSQDPHLRDYAVRQQEHDDPERQIKHRDRVSLPLFAHVEVPHPSAKFKFVDHGDGGWCDIYWLIPDYEGEHLG